MMSLAHQSSSTPHEGEEVGSVGPDELEEQGDSEGHQDDEDGKTAHMPEFVPSLNQGGYTFTDGDGSPVEHCNKLLP